LLLCENEARQNNKESREPFHSILLSEEIKKVKGS
jgi:hypothetical protein